MNPVHIYRGIPAQPKPGLFFIISTFRVAPRKIEGISPGAVCVSDSHK